jgi:uncharacterized metal-binding protein
MPSGRTHDRITLWCLPFVIGLSLLLSNSLALSTIVSLSFLVGGLMLGPDLDIHSIQYRRWGPIKGIWIPYRMALKHRSSLSHGPIVGTALRVIYLSLWIALCGIIAVQLLNSVWDAQLTWQSISVTFNYLLKHYLTQWLAILIGLEVGAMSHSISDTIGSALIRLKRRKKKATHQKHRD